MTPESGEISAGGMNVHENAEESQIDTQGVRVAIEKAQLNKFIDSPSIYPEL